MDTTDPTDRQVLTDRRLLLDRRLLTDPTRCPSCGGLLSERRCPRCLLDVSGAAGLALWQVSTRAASLLSERDRLIDELRPAVERTRAAVRATAPMRAEPRVPVRVPDVPAASAAPTGRPAPGADRTARRADRPARLGGVQGLLVGLGALLLTIAAVVFLAFSWDLLGLSGRAGVVGVVTLGVLVGAVQLNRCGLGSTAEAVGAVGVALVILDAWAVYATGLMGVDSVDAWTYASLASAGCTGVLLGWHRWSRVRAGSLAASVLAPLTPVLAGVALADEVQASWAAVALGLTGAAAVAAGRAVLVDLYAVERRLLGWVAGLATSAAAVTCLATLLDGERWTAATVLGIAAAVAALQAVTVGADGGRPASPRMWSAVAGALLTAGATAAGMEAPGGQVLAAVPALTGVVVAVLVVTGLVVNGPAVTAATARASVRPGMRGLSMVDAAWGSAGVTALVCLPSLLVVLAGVLAWVQATAIPAWGQGIGFTFVADPILGPYRSATLGIGALAAISLGVCALPRRSSQRPAGAAVGAASWLVALVLLVWLPQSGMALGFVLAAYLALAAGAAALTAGVSGHALHAAWATAAAAGVLAVVGSWGTRELSVPMTVAGAAALLLARLPARSCSTRVPVRAALAGVSGVAVVVSAGATAVLVDGSDADVATTAGLVAAGLLGAAGTLRGRYLRDVSGLDRVAVAVPALVVLATAVLATAVLTVELGTLDGSGVPWPHPQLLLAASLAAVACTAGLPRGRSPVPDDVAAAAAGLVPVLTAATVVSVGGGLGVQASGALLAAGTAAGAGVLAAVLGLRAPGDVRRLPLEVGVALTAMAALAGAAFEVDLLWVVLMLVGTAAAAVALAPGRRPVGWPALVLLSASSWVRLQLSDVELVEAYTLPTAGVLLCLGLLRLRRDASASSWSMLGTGLGLALLPSVLAGATGSPIRPLALLLFGVVVLTVAVALQRRSQPSRDRLVPVLLLAGTGASGGAILRALSGAVGAADAAVEAWSLPTAAVLTVAGWLVAGRSLPALPLWCAVQVTRGQVLAGGVALATVPTAIAVLAQSGAGGTRGGSLIVGGCLLWALGAASRLGERRRDEGSAQFGAGTTASRSGVAVAVTGGALGLLVGVGPAVEVWTFPVAALLIAGGVLALHLDPGTRSWRRLGPGLTVLLLPTLVLSVPDTGAWRPAVLAGLALAVVVAGAVRREQAPLLLGGAVLVVHALVQLAPWLSDAYQAVPRWAALAFAGVVLITLGATYERRARDVRRLGLRIASMR